MQEDVKKIINTLMAGKPVLNTKTDDILYIKGFILGKESQDMNEGRDYDFDDLSNLEIYVSKETKEVERLTKLLNAQTALVKERDKEIIALKTLKA